MASGEQHRPPEPRPRPEEVWTPHPSPPKTALLPAPWHAPSWSDRFSCQAALASGTQAVTINMLPLDVLLCLPNQGTDGMVTFHSPAFQRKRCRGRAQEQPAGRGGTPPALALTGSGLSTPLSSGWLSPRPGTGSRQSLRRPGAHPDFCLCLGNRRAQAQNHILAAGSPQESDGSPHLLGSSS